MLLNGKRLRYQFLHAGLYLLQQRLVQPERTLSGNKQRVAKGIFDTDTLNMFAADNIIKRLEHQKNGAAFIGLHTGFILNGYHLQRAVPIQLLPQFAESSVSFHQENLV